MSDKTPENATPDSEEVDPRLDNRTGRQRPPLETFPAKPQQIDGPSLADQPDAREAAEIVKEDDSNDVTRKGMSSPGPHGLGDTEAVPFEDGKHVTDSDTKGKAASEEAKTSRDAK